MTQRLRSAGCVFAPEEAALLCAEASDDAGLEVMLCRREAGEPLEHILGWAEFDGLRIPVAPGVFIPRRRSMALLEQAARRLRAGDEVLEVCCGAAPIAAALQRRVRGLRAVATDIDPVAVSCARHHVAEVYCGDLFDAVPPQRFTVIVANAPYVPSGALATLPRESRHEHRVALDGGPDGLRVHARVAARAGDWLLPGGSVLCEAAAHQVEELVRLFAGYDVDVSIDGDYEVAVLVARAGGAVGCR